jgi:hypothetical protein
MSKPRDDELRVARPARREDKKTGSPTVKQIFRMICAIAAVDRFDAAQQALSQLPYGGHYRTSAVGGPVTIAASASGELPATHYLSLNPFCATLLDTISTPDVRIVFLHDGMTLDESKLHVVPSYFQFGHAEDFASKVDEHLAAIVRFLGLRKGEPQPASVPQLAWPASPQPTSISLPNGRYCLIREKYANAGGHLVIEADYWDSEADYNQRPNTPEASHDHEFCSKDGAAISPDDPQVGHHILSLLNAVTKDDRNFACKPHPRGADKVGWLDHPHVQSLGVKL